MPQVQQRIYYFLWQLYHLQQDEATALQQQQELRDRLEELTERNNRWGLKPQCSSCFTRMERLPQACACCYTHMDGCVWYMSCFHGVLLCVCTISTHSWPLPAVPLPPLLRVVCSFDSEISAKSQEQASLTRQRLQLEKEQKKLQRQQEKKVRGP